MIVFYFIGGVEKNSYNNGRAEQGSQHTWSRKADQKGAF